MKVIVAPYEVKDLDSKEARIVENVQAISESLESYCLEFTSQQDYEKAVRGIHRICVHHKDDDLMELYISRDSMVVVLL